MTKLTIALSNLSSSLSLLAAPCAVVCLIAIGIWLMFGGAQGLQKAKPIFGSVIVGFGVVSLAGTIVEILGTMF